jgi:plastocyanin
MKRTLAALTLVLVTALVAGGCSKKSSTAVNTGGNGNSSDPYGSAGGSTTSTGASSGTPAGVSLTGQVTNKGTVDATGKSTFELEADNDGGEYYFKPTFVKVTSAETVKVTVKNEGSVQHTFTIDSLNINEPIDPGKSVQVNVFLPAGTTSRTFYCRFHRSSGMQGAFTTT